VVVQRLVCGKRTGVGQVRTNSKGPYSIKIKIRKPRGSHRAVISSTARYSTAISGSFTR